MNLIKVFDPFPRAPDLTLPEFSEHWTTGHAAIAARLQQILHYVQTHRLENAPPGLHDGFGPTWCDGSSETWYADVASLVEMTGEPACQELMQDEARFMDLDQPRFPIITKPHELDRSGFDPNDRGVKLLLFVRRAHGLNVDAFHAAWTSDADLDAGRALGLTRHIVAPALPATYEFLHPNYDRLDVEGSGNGEAPFDGVRELWWASRTDLERALRDSPEAWRTLLHGECTDIARSLALFGRERVIAPEPEATSSAA